MGIKAFSDLANTDADSAGGKGASLGELTKAGIPVPPGFVVLASTFDEFIHSSGLHEEIQSLLSKVDTSIIHTVEHASENIQSLIKHAAMPESIKESILGTYDSQALGLVAVRSSATAEDGDDHAWAGQLESYMNISREQLCRHVQLCWASLYTPRAIFYRFEKELHDTHISVAVVVQQMVHSEKSGIAFSVHPVTENPNHIIIEAGFGFGDAIVSGSVTPDSYVVAKDTDSIVETYLNTQKKKLRRRKEDEPIDPRWGENVWEELSAKEAKEQKLSNQDILVLAKIVKNIEAHYGKPMDIEWAYEDGTFYITQSRPITTLSSNYADQHTSKPIYTKEFARDFSLPLVELWCNAETTDPRRWTTHEQPIIPYQIFRRVQDTVNNYIDQQGITWVKDEIRRLLKEDTHYVTWLLEMIGKELDILQPLYDHPRVLEKEELLKFIEQMRSTWAPFEGMWWLMEVLDEDKDSRFKDVEMMRERTNHFSTGADAIIRLSLTSLYPNLGELSSVLLYDEIKNDSLPSTQELEQRLHDGYVYANSKLFVGEDVVSQVERTFDIEIEKDLQEFTGTVISGDIASKGYAKGRVKRLMGSVHNDKVEEGDIIVTSMTMPDMMPAMKKAAAFVTDEGGVTCHAAIIARELGKPCIIGTKIASQVLKDGDLVEVDANKGEVRIQSSSLNKDDYILSFRVDGVSVFVTDIHNDVLKRLDALFIIDSGTFKQYFTKVAYEKALEEGLEFYADENKFSKYKEDLENHIRSFDEFYKNKIKGKHTISKKDLSTFFEYTKKLCGDYCYMNYEYTDKAFQEQDNHTHLKKNLEVLSVFKDQVRDAMNSALFEDDGYLSNLFGILSRQFNKSKEYFDNLTQDEILALYDGKFPQSDVALRQQAFVQGSTISTFYEGSDAQEILEVFKDEKIDTNTISGDVANKGKVISKVKIITVDYSNLDKVSREMEEMEKGDVLIAETTAPELMIACKKASAIVTDMGGMMSHAAIVSRELGIPCIVNTQHATRVLNNGDLVEVDADTGVVRLIQSKDIDISQWELEFQQRDYHPPLMADQWCKSLHQHFATELQLDVPNYDYLFTGTSKGYVKTQQKKELLDTYMEALEDQKYVDFMFKTTMERIEELGSFTKKEYSIENLLEHWKEYNEIFLRVIPWFWIPYYPSETNFFSNKVEEGLQTYKDKIESYTDLNNALAILCFPTKQTLLQKEQEDYYALLELATQGKNYEAEAIQYLEDHAYLKTFIELPIEPLSRDELDNKIQTSLDSSDLEEYQLQQSKKKENTLLLNQLLLLFEDDKELLQNITNAQELGWLLSSSVELALDYLSRLQPFFKSIAAKINVNYADWMYLTIDEIEAALAGSKVNLQEITKRKQSYVYLMENGIRTLFSGEVATQKTIWIDEHTVEDIQDTSSLQGQGVSPGVAIGKTRYIAQAQDSHTLKEGEILVCSMTSPDYVPAMKKASAILTDEGGLLCHAAIVSRELGKPCIVGTKHATRFFANGDVAYVDADRGDIRKLNDYLYSWGGEGFSLLFQSIFYESLSTFDFFDSFCVLKDKQLKVYWSREARTLATEYGKKIFSSRTSAEKPIHEAYASVKYLLSFTPKDIFIAQQAEKFFSHMESFLVAYMHLDPEFSDEALRELNDANLLEYLGEHKNKLREELNAIFFTEDAIFKQVLGVIAEKISVSVDDLQALTLGDIKEILLTFRMKEQHAEFFLISKNGTTTYVYEPSFISIAFDIQEPEKEVLLQGTTVSKKEICQGIVKKLTIDYSKNLEEEIQRINATPGTFIFVADHTSPELLPIMKKSLAIVTQMGGILSHAAITSRELDVPCVVGVEGIMSVLEDGELIEVDAVSGIIKRLDALSVVKSFAERSNNLTIQQGNLSLLLLGNACDVISSPEFSQLYGFKFKDLIYIQEGKTGTVYFNEKDYQTCSRLTYKKIENRVEDVEEYKLYQTTAKEITHLFEKELPSESKDIIENVKKLIAIEKRILACTLFSESLDHDLGAELALQEGVSNIDEFIEVSSLTTFPSFLLRQLEAIQGDQDIRWMFTDYYSSVKNPPIQKWIEEQGGIDQIKQQIKETHELIENNKKIQQEFVTHLNTKQKLLFEYISLGVRVRDQRKTYVQKIMTLISDSMHILADKLDISYDDISTVHLSELDKLLNPEFIQEVKERTDSVLQFCTHSGSSLMTVDAKKVHELVSPKLKSHGELKGVPAMKGKVVGRANIVLSRDDFSQFKEGDILITSMTRPEFVPLMKKASAVLTNEGGITCHAAVISRELQIPCIIGMKNITLSVKTGDLLEVDATSGVVRRVE